MSGTALAAGLAEGKFKTPVASAKTALNTLWPTFSGDTLQPQGAICVAAFARTWGRNCSRDAHVLANVATIRRSGRPAPSARCMRRLRSFPPHVLNHQAVGGK